MNKTEFENFAKNNLDIQTISIRDLVVYCKDPIEWIKNNNIKYVYNIITEEFINSCFVTNEFVKHYDRIYNIRENMNYKNNKAIEQYFLITVLFFVIIGIGFSMLAFYLMKLVDFLDTPSLYHITSEKVITIIYILLTLCYIGLFQMLIAYILTEITIQLYDIYE